MPRKLALPDLRDLYRMYEAGESTVELAKRFGCHSSTLRNMFKRNGLAVRDASAAHIVHNAKISPVERRRRAEAAHAAVRGRRVPIEQQVAMALGRERAARPMPPSERAVAGVLRRMGYTVRRQRALGPYNLDFALGDSIAVEVFGGGWHSGGRHAARHLERTRYVLNAGFDVVIVWIQQGYGRAWVAALKDQLADLQRPSRDPASPREYRVIWGAGEVLALSAHSDHFPLKPATEVRRNASGRYERVW